MGNLDKMGEIFFLRALLLPRVIDSFDVKEIWILNEQFFPYIEKRAQKEKWTEKAPICSILNNETISRETPPHFKIFAFSE